MDGPGGLDLNKVNISPLVAQGCQFEAGGSSRRGRLSDRSTVCSSEDQSAVMSYPEYKGVVTQWRRCDSTRLPLNQRHLNV